jgi:hypothetical protein
MTAMTGIVTVDNVRPVRFSERTKPEAFMLTKCICTNCAGHLEFEEENAGEKIKCPHCGFETTLFLPGEEPEEADSPVASNRLWRFKGPLIATIAVLAVLAAAVYSLGRWVLPPLKLWLPYTESPVLPVVVLALACLAALMLICWTFFPILLFLQMRKLTGVLQEIEANGRPVLSAEPMIEEDSKDAASEENSNDRDEQQLTPAE